MKRILTLIVIVAATVIAGSTNANAQAQKFGYIDVNELISVMPQTKKADTTLAQFREALIQNAQDKQTELQEAYNKFVADSAKMAPAVKEVKRKELQDKIQENSGMDQKLNEQFEQKRQELAAPIQKLAMETIKEVAKEAGYTYVFLKDALLVAPPADDIMALVKKKLGIIK
jgi:outer membrane protein